MAKYINIGLLIFIISFESCAMGAPRIKDYQAKRDKSQTFYWPCEDEQKFCSKTCENRKSNGDCKKWHHRKRIDINNLEDWNLLKNGDFVLIKRMEVFR